MGQGVGGSGGRWGTARGRWGKGRVLPRLGTIVECFEPM